MDTTKIKKLKELEKENTRLKRLVADDVPPDYVPTFMLVPLLETGKVER